MKARAPLPIALALLIPLGCTAGKAASKPAPVPAAPSGPAPAVVVAEPVKVEADETRTTPSGASFAVSKGWYLAQREGYVLLEDPERELDLALVESHGTSGAEAIAAAWKRFRPDFNRPVFQSHTAPPKEPWDEILQIVYDVPAQEQRMVVGAGRRHGDTWYVALIDGTGAALNRRGAQLNTTVGSWKPAGTKEESLADRAAKPLDEARRKELDRFVEEWRQKARVPGVAMVVVQGGQVVIAEGFGERELGKGQRPTPDSLFLIGSETKSLTTLMMARLVDEGRFGWDTKVQSLLPAFALGDPAATQSLEMRHTVCACTGLPRQDMEFLFEFAGITPEMRLEQMRAMKPTTGFGETFQYSNTMVSAGGYIAAHAADPEAKLDPAYLRAMQSRVFDPLGMKSTTFDFAAAQKGDHATPHGLDIREEPQPIPLAYETTVRSVAPAGGAWSSAHDMAQYLLMELSGGMGPGQKRFLSEQNLLARRQPQTQVSDKAAYGLGLFLQDDRGLHVLSHGGNTLGFTSDMFFIPEKGVGAVLLTNAQGANSFTGAVRGKLLELWFDAKPRAEDGLKVVLRERDETVAKTLPRVAMQPDSGWAKPYLGTWKNPGLGEIRIASAGGDLSLDAGEWKSAAAKYTDVDGSTGLVLTGAPLAGLELLLEQKDGKPTLLLDAGQQKYVFEPKGGG